MNQTKPQKHWAEKELEKVRREKAETEKELKKIQRDRAVTEFVVGVVGISCLLYFWYQQYQRKKEMEEALKDGFFLRKPAATAPEDPNEREH